MKKLITTIISMLFCLNSYAANMGHINSEVERARIVNKIDKRIIKEERRRKTRNYDKIKKRAMKKLVRSLKRSPVEKRKEVIKKFQKHLDESGDYVTLLKSTRNKLMNLDSDELEIMFIFSLVIIYAVYVLATVVSTVSVVTGTSQLVSVIIVYFGARFLYRTWTESDKSLVLIHNI